MEIIIQIIIIIFTVKEDRKEGATESSQVVEARLGQPEVGSAFKPAWESLNPCRVGPGWAAAGVGAEVAVGTLPIVETEATSTSYPEQNELNTKL